MSRVITRRALLKRFICSEGAVEVRGEASFTMYRTPPWEKLGKLGFFFCGSGYTSFCYHTRFMGGCSLALPNKGLPLGSTHSVKGFGGEVGGHKMASDSGDFPGSMTSSGLLSASLPTRPPMLPRHDCSSYSNTVV